MSEQPVFYSLAQIGEQLSNICNEKRSGTLYLFTQAGNGAVCTIERGRIIDIFYRSIRGAAAFQHIKQIDTAKVLFKAGAVADPRQKPGYVPLPSNEEIFRLLGLEHQPSSGQPNQQNNKTVLVVEDSGVTRKIIVRTLTKMGCNVVEAEDGLDALGQLASNTPDLILLDLILPKIDGYKVLSNIKRKDEYKNIPVIILTSRASLMDKVKGKVSGTDEYLTKPFKADELIEKVKKYL